MAAVRWDAASATIAARATPPGRGGLAVIRISGPGTRTILSALGAGRVLESPPRTAVLASIRASDGALLDRGLVTFFPSPASFTGEDSGELSVHGGPVVVASVLEACFAAGARQAEAGEFTRRAWANGKLDRIQVEAIQDLVEAESPRFHRVAVQQVEGGLSRRLAAVRQGLVEVRVGLAHHLDFPDEDEAPTSAGALAERLGELERSLQTLLSTAPGGRLLREGAVVVLAGRPNAGKSSLFNALLGEERVLVTPHAGTTRDAVDAMVSLNGFPFRVVDTAGLRESADEVESAGIEVAHRWIQGAQVLVWCHAAEMGPPTGEEVAALQALRSGTEAVLLPLATCIDRLAGVAGVARGAGGAPGGFEAPDPWPEPEGWPEIGGRRWMPVSVVTGQGLEDVGKALVESVFGTPAEGTGGDGASAEEGHVLVRERQRTLVSAALGEIQVARARVAEGAPAELADLHLAEAEGALEALVGAVDSDEVMDALFREFCIGK